MMYQVEHDGVAINTKLVASVGPIRVDSDVDETDPFFFSVVFAHGASMFFNFGSEEEAANARMTLINVIDREG